MANESGEKVWATPTWGEAESLVPELDVALMAMLLEHISTRVAVVGRDHTYLYANRETLRFMGLPAEQVIGKHMSQVLDAGVYQHIVPFFDRAFAGEQLRRNGWANYAKQGLRFREQWYVPYRPGGGPVQAVVVCGLDHTEQRLGEKELEEKRAELRASETRKSAIIERQREALRQSEKLTTMGKLLAGVSHELNNPLAIVMGRASLLEEKCEDQPALRQDAQHIREAAERCARIVRTFLNMARSKPPLRSAVVLNDAVRSCVEMLAYTYRSHDIGLSLALDVDLPEVSADLDQICQIVLNLLVNAQQALAQMPGVRRVRVSTGSAQQHGALRAWVRVADNGPGVERAAQSRIFDAFFTTKAEGMGTGMGLSVSRDLAREHGGDLQLEADEPTVGAAFCLSLPVLPAAHGALVRAPNLARPIEAGPLTRVLVVDDEAELAGVMREMLEAAGYEVATAESGAVALELLATARFDAVVSDLRMPGMDGATLWRQVQTKHPALIGRMLFVTGDTLSPEAASFFKRSGCTGLDKPFAKTDLLTKLAAMLRSVPHREGAGSESTGTASVRPSHS